jgi:hypothetical protein
LKKIYKQRAKDRIKVETVRVKLSSALPSRAASASNGLNTIKEVFSQLFSDENFVTLLRAESMTAIPAYLRPLMKEGNNEHEARS